MAIATQVAPDSAKVLVAHDVRGYADTIAAIVGAGGFSTRTVYDGRGVALLAESWRPECAILKLELSGVTGLELAPRLRRAYGRSMWLVGSTEGTSTNFRKEAEQAGFDRVVARPVDNAEFLLALDGPGAVLVMRSMAATARRLRLLISSAQNQAHRARSTKNREQRRTALAFAWRAHDYVVREFEVAQITPFERDLLSTEVVALAKSLSAFSKSAAAPA